MAFVRFSSLTSVSESGDGTTGWIYTRTGAGDYTTSYAGGSDQTCTGDFEVIYIYASGEPNGGLDDDNTADHSGNWIIGCYSVGGDYEFVINGSFGTPADAAVAGAVGDWIRYQRRGSTLTVAVSKTSGASWTTIRTDTGFTTGTVYPGLNFNAASSIGPVYFAPPVSLALHTATAAAPNLTVTATQPVSLSVATAAGAAPNLTVTAQQPVTPGVAAGTGTAPNLSTASVQPVSLSVATAAGAAPNLTVAGIQPVSLGVASASAAAPNLTATAQQPVSLGLAQGTANALTLETDDGIADDEDDGHRFGRRATLG